MKLSVIILNYKTKELTSRAIESVLNLYKANDYELILIDNDSADSSADFLVNKYGSDSRIKFILNDQNLGFSKAVNQGIRASTGEYIFLLNSDAELHSNALETLVGFLDTNGGYAIAGARMVDQKGDPVISFGNFPTLIREVFFNLFHFFPWFRIIKPAGLSKKLFGYSHDTDWISGGAMMLRRAAIEKIGLFDEAYFMYVEDIDLCRRVALCGMKVRYVSEAIVSHVNRASSGSMRSKVWNYENLIYYFEKFYAKRKLYTLAVNSFLRAKLYLIKKSK